MGMLDSETTLADGMAVTAIGDTPSTNSYDTGGTNGQGDLGQTNERLWFHISADTAATSGGSATVQGVLQVSDDNATWSDLVIGTATPVASVVAGYDLLNVQPPTIPLGNPSRYYRGVVRVATASLTGGTFSAYFANTTQHNIARQSGIPAVA